MTHLYLAASSNIGTTSRELDAWDWQARPLNVLDDLRPEDARAVVVRGRGRIDRVHGCNGCVLGPTLRYSIERVLDLEQRLAAHWARELAAARAT